METVNKHVPVKQLIMEGNIVLTSANRDRIKSAENSDTIQSEHSRPITTIHDRLQSIQQKKARIL